MWYQVGTRFTRVIIRYTNVLITSYTPETNIILYVKCNGKINFKIF